MHKGVFVGKKAEQSENRILILGESHHSANENDDYTTSDVIETYRNIASNSFVFFDKIVQSFNIRTDSKVERFTKFWENVYFGNYVDEYCGVKDGKAKEYAKINREKYNNELFDFLNNNHIEKVFVFSRLVYNNLPSFSKENKIFEKLPDLDDGKLKIGKKRDYISQCKYLPNTNHNFTTVELNHEVSVFGMRHPSAQSGYNAENYSAYLKKLL